MPQLAEMDRGTGISRPGSPSWPHSRSMVMAAMVVGKVQLFLPLLHAHGRMIREAPANFSTMEYMLVTLPTASLSVRP